LDPYFSATKIRWLLDHTRANPDRVAFGTVDTWLVWRLTKGRVHVTDVTNASRTMLFDIRRGDWDDELLRIFNVPRQILPRVVSSSEIVGETDDGVPIAGVVTPKKFGRPKKVSRVARKFCCPRTRDG